MVKKQTTPVKKPARKKAGKKASSKPTKTKASANKVVMMEKALELRLKGLSFAKIAEQLGCVKSTAFEWVTEALKETTSRVMKNAEDLRTIELERLDRVAIGLYPKACKGSPAHVHQYLNVHEKRIKLLGLQPTPEVLGEMITESKEDGGISVKVKFVKPE